MGDEIVNNSQQQDVAGQDTQDTQVTQDDELSTKIDTPEESPKSEGSGVLDKVLENAAGTKTEDTEGSKDGEGDEEVNETDNEKKGPPRLEDMEKEELIENVKKWMSIAEKRKVEAEKLKNQPTDDEISKFIEGLKSDFVGTYQAYYDKFGLPAPEAVQNSFTNTFDIDSRLEQWQKEKLIPEIEKKFGLEKGTFVPDPTDWYNSKTPTGYFRRMSEQKERELQREVEQLQQEKEQILQNVIKQREEDLKYIKEKFFENEDEFNQKLSEFDSFPEKIAKGELPPERNPFAIRNIFRGVYFDELADALIKKAVNEVHQKYNSLGLYLPKEDNAPTDVTKQSGTPEKRDTPVKGFSMIERQLGKLNK